MAAAVRSQRRKETELPRGGQSEGFVGNVIRWANSGNMSEATT